MEGPHHKNRFRKHFKEDEDEQYQYGVKLNKPEVEEKKDEGFNELTPQRDFLAPTPTRNRQRQKQDRKARPRTRPVSANAPPPLNFNNWIVILTAIGNLVLSSLIIFMGIQSSKFDYAGLMIVDRALIALGISVIIISIIAIIGIAQSNEKILLFVLFGNIVSGTLLLVFGIGAILFSGNLLSWIDSNWDLFKRKVPKMSMSDFKSHVSSELTSLGAFSFTIIISIGIMIVGLTQLIHTRRLATYLFPVTNLMYLVFSTAIFFIGIYTKQHSYFTNTLPIWTNYLLSGIAVFMLVIALTGYLTYFNMKVRPTRNNFFGKL